MAPPNTSFQGNDTDFHSPIEMGADGREGEDGVK